MTSTASPAIGRTISHFSDLDFLRGVAAILVMLFHFGERSDLAWLAPHGFLAVDLFFVMSGFVLSHAYGARLADGRLRLSRFVLLRILRFLPMIWLGTAIAAVIELGRPGGLGTQHLLDTLAALLRGLLLVPTFTHGSLEQTCFPLDGPAWTLFFEVVANIAFGVAVIVRAPKPAIGLLGLVSAIWLGLYLGHRPSFEYAGAVATDFLVGFPRVALSMVIGVGLHRLKLPRPHLNRWVLASILLVLAMVPPLPGLAEPVFNMTAVLVIFPLIVLLATSAPPQAHEPFIVRWSGLISYPLYAVHYPVLRAVGFLVLRAHLSLGGRLAVVVATSAALVLFAAACEWFLDRPLRYRLRALVRP